MHSVFASLGCNDLNGLILRYFQSELRRFCCPNRECARETTDEQKGLNRSRNPGSIIKVKIQPDHAGIMTKTLFLLNEPRRVLASGMTLQPFTTIVVGRSQTCGLHLPDPTVSRRHAEIQVREQSITLIDLNSRNGTFVNECQVVTCEVEIGQQVRFGKVVFRLIHEDEKLVSADSEIETSDPRLENRNHVDAKEPRLTSISPAQQRVLDLLLSGLGEKQVAFQLDISQHTVHNHTREIYRALGVHSRPELFVRMRELGLITATVVAPSAK